MNREHEWLLKEKYGGKECTEFFDDLKRLESGEPLAYVIGWVGFLGCRIDLSKRPLIPRPETEWWVERVIQKSKVKSQHAKILDLFSGSGCIGVALAKHLPSVTVDCADVSPAAIEEIRINAELNGVTDRVRAIASDVFSGIPGTYDLILANPPYIDPNIRETLERSVLDYEPHEALFATDGLEYIRLIVEQCDEHLEQGGSVCVEFGPNQKEDIERLLDKSGWQYEFWKDQYDRWRVMKLNLA